MRFLLFLLISLGTAYAQNCNPEVLELERKQMVSGDYKGAALLNKMESLIKEMKKLTTGAYQGAQKNAMKHCLKVKQRLFEKLMVRPDPLIQEGAPYQSTMAEFWTLLNEPQTALVYIDRAVEIDPRNLALLIKNLHIYAQAQNLELKEIADKPIAINETQRVFNEFSKRAGRIAEHPETTKSLAIETLTYQAKIAKALKNYPQEMQFWEKILVLDPQSQLAHQNRLAYFLSKKQVADATETMKRLARDNLATDKNWSDFLEMLSNAEKWDDYVSWSNKAPAKVLANNPDLQIRLARAHLELGRRAEAEKIMNKVPKNLKGNTALLAAQNTSRLTEFQADDFKAQGRLSEALDEYKKALPASPRPLSVKEKISLLIYEYRKGLDFKPAEATKKDLGEVVSLLAKSVYETELKANLFGIYLHSLTLTQQPVELKKACLRFKEVYPELIRSKDYSTYCH